MTNTQASVNVVVTPVLKVIVLSASSHHRSDGTTETPALTELIEEIEDDNMVTTTTVQVDISK